MSISFYIQVTIDVPDEQQKNVPDEQQKNVPIAKEKPDENIFKNLMYYCKDCNKSMSCLSTFRHFKSMRHLKNCQKH